MDFLGLQDRTVAVFGVANRRSVAYAVGKVLAAAGANVVYVVRDADVRESVLRLVGEARVLSCNVECEDEIAALATELSELTPAVDGVVHSIAYANYRDGTCAFHETDRADFLQAVDISCYSLIGIVRHLRPLLSERASVVTISISTTRMAAENYGYMAPIKAALDSAVVFLAKSLSADSQVRVNAVGAGLLKTSASAGIPGYVDSYLFAEQVIPRKHGLATEEVANAVAFLLSERSSGVNAQTIVVDAGMSINYFDRAVVREVVNGLARSGR